jgi:hypothetical protein
MPTDTIPAAAALVPSSPKLGGAFLGIDFGPFHVFPKDGNTRSVFDQNGNSTQAYYDPVLKSVICDRPGTFAWFGP